MRVPSGPHFFAELIVNMWNCLFSDTVDFSSFTAFKRTIKYVDFSDFLKFTQQLCVLVLTVLRSVLSV